MHDVINVKDGDIIDVKDGVVLNSLLWDLVVLTDDYILNLGIFTKFNSAVGEAYRIACDELEDKTQNINPLFRLEADGGWGFEVTSSDGKTVKTFYILEVSNEGDIISNQ